MINDIKMYQYKDIRAYSTVHSFREDMQNWDYKLTAAAQVKHDDLSQGLVLNGWF